MQDRFKFRAWLKLDKKLVDIYQITDNDSIHFIKFKKWDDDINTPNWASLDTVELMQSTGLKDKNGKLIFEGDVVKNKYKCIYKIQYESGCFWFGESEISYFGNDYFEIIGNIYENPELLEDN